jgi:hypothetical protein
MHTVENPGGGELRFLPKSLGSMLFKQNLKGIHYFGGFIAFLLTSFQKFVFGRSYVTPFTPHPTPHHFVHLRVQLKRLFVEIFIFRKIFLSLPVFTYYVCILFLLSSPS